MADFTVAPYHKSMEKIHKLSKNYPDDPDAMGRAGCFPDFLGIGTTRGGSSWLYRMLSRHPAVWLPPVKEIHYFDKPRHGVRTFTVFRPRMMAVRVRDYLQGERKYSTGDTLLQSLAWDKHFFFQPRSPEWYRQLFRPRPDQITGEVTPAYAILDREIIEEINRANPSIKAIYILRNPVERAWSSIVNHLARKQGRKMAQVPNDEIMEKVDSIGSNARADYAGNLQRWWSVIGKDRVFIGYMEEIKANPTDLLERICSFLDIEPLPDDRDDTAGKPVNTTQKHGGDSMPDEIRYELSRNLLPIIKETAGLLGGYTERWLSDAEETIRNFEPRENDM